MDAKSATFRFEGYEFNVVDLPGTYSISAYSNEEKYVREYIMNNAPDVVINVVDASNLERNLYLSTQLELIWSEGCDRFEHVLIAGTFRGNFQLSGDGTDDRDADDAHDRVKGERN